MSTHVEVRPRLAHVAPPPAPRSSAVAAPPLKQSIWKKHKTLWLIIGGITLLIIIVLFSLATYSHFSKQPSSESPHEPLVEAPTDPPVDLKELARLRDIRRQQRASVATPVAAPVDTTPVAATPVVATPVGTSVATSTASPDDTPEDTPVVTPVVAPVAASIEEVLEETEAPETPIAQLEQRDNVAETGELDLAQIELRLKELN